MEFIPVKNPDMTNRNRQILAQYEIMEKGAAGELSIDDLNISGHIPNAF